MPRARRQQQRRNPIPDEHRRNPDILADTIIPTASGKQFPLRTLATVETIDGFATINGKDAPWHSWLMSPTHPIMMERRSQRDLKMWMRRYW